MSGDSVRHNTLRGTALITIADALAVPAGLLAVIYLTRRFGPERFGIFTLAYSIVAWLEWTIASFFSRATIRIVSDSEDPRDAAGALLRMQGGVGIVAAVALWVGADAVASAFGEPQLTPALRLFALDVPIFTIAQTYRSIQVGLGRFSRRALAAAVRTAARLIMLVLLVEAGFSVEGAILSGIGASIAEMAVVARGVNARFGTRRSILVELWDVGVPTFLFALFARALDRLDLWILKWLGASAAEAGLYGAAQSAGRVPMLLAGSLAPLVLASMTRLLRERREGEARELGVEAIRIAFLLVPFAACGAASAKALIPLAFGARYAAAWPLASALVFAALAMLLLYVCGSILTAHGQPWRAFAVSAFLAPVQIIGCLVLIPRMGSVGAALVTAAMSVGGAVAGLALLRRAAGIVPPYGLIARVGLLALTLSAGLWIIDPRGWQVVPALLVAWALTAGALVATKDLNLAEIGSLVRPSPPADVVVTEEG